MHTSNLQKAIEIFEKMKKIDEIIEILSDEINFRFESVKIRNRQKAMWLGEDFENKGKEYMRHVLLIEAEKEKTRLLNVYEELDAFQG